MSITCYTRPIQYYETDRMGVVHHSNYIRWMEEARVDFMNQCGLPYAKLEQRGIMMPVLSASCQYKVAQIDFILRNLSCGYRYIVRNRRNNALLHRCQHETIPVENRTS